MFSIQRWMIRGVWLASFLMTAPTWAQPAEPSETISVLFLGDQGHHRPAERARQLIPVMYDRGIEIAYTEKLSDLNAETLGKYDALAIYANIERIEPEQEQALLDYVAGGRGLVVLHCGSYCFLNSAKYIALVGGQFRSHGTGEFNTEVKQSDHPVMRGLTPFRTWDETYVHHRHNERDRIVLQVRREGDREEPWTWLRSEGRGRVFYTAYGHDARTWNQPEFQALVERGIRWAANKGDVFDSQPPKPTGAKAFEYAEANLPNYLPNARWGTQGEPIRQMQKPLPTEESIKHLVVPRDFEPRLFAAEPEITKPIAMTWDHRGRLWIAETFDYPNEMQPKGSGRDRIKICEDTDGDGRADKFTVFADKLSIPTSLVCYGDGVIVSQAPDMLFLRDTDGDDRADERQVLFTGWGTRDTHAGPSNLRWGFDNWVWGMVGYSGYRGTVGGERHNFRQGFFRFKPDGSKLEFMRNTNNNSWGVGFSEEGLVFGSTANGCPSVYLPIPNRYYERVRGWSPTVLGNTAINNRMYPITDKVRQVDWHGGFTAGAGHALYTARTYPQHYWNRTAFVAEPTGHLVATFLLERQGSDVTSHNSWNLLASRDEWTAPIAAEVGPDGNVWVIDWYNYIVQHNPTPQGFRTGRGAAYETDLRDKKHGRVYRIVYNKVDSNEQPKLDANNSESLIAGLKSDNQFWRLHAQRLLVERGKQDVVPQLVKLVDDPSVDSIGLNTAAIHALYVLDGLGALKSDAAARQAAEAALKHPSAGVRRNALAVLPRDERSVTAVLGARSMQDRDAQVRLAALLALADMPPSSAVADAVVAAMANPANLNDRWLPEAVTSAAAAHDLHFLQAIAARESDRRLAPKAAEMVGRIAEHYARGAPAETIGALVGALQNARSDTGELIVAGLARGWPRNAPAKLDEPAEKALARLLVTVSPAAKSQLILLAERLGSGAIEKYSTEIAATLLAAVNDEKATDAARGQAAAQLVQMKKNDAETAATLLALITPRTSQDLAAGLVEAVGASEAKEAGEALVAALQAATPSLRPVLVRTILRRAESTQSLLAAVDAGNVRITDLSLDQQQALAAHPDKSIAERAKKLLAQGGGLPDADRQKVIEEVSPLVLAGGDAVKGKAVFKEQCAKCHTHSGEGVHIGPDLTGMAVHPKEELLVHVLDPSRSVEGNYVQYSVTTDEGLVYNGLLTTETRTSIEILDAEGKRHPIARENIEELATSSKSLMPDGFEKQVSVAAIADLMEFMAQRGKYLPLDLRKVATITSTRGMFQDEESAVERLVFSDWSLKTFEGVPFLLVDPQGGRVKNVILLHSPNGVMPPKMPRSVSLACKTPARRIHLLSGVSGWGYNGGDPRSTVSMIVRLKYADGQTEDHELKDGIHFADYIRPIDVPESKLAFRLRGQQIRYLSIEPKRSEMIESIELVKGRDRTAPIVMAVTVQTEE
ncbi:MAG: PVC-type heme-binding CxxCH protein [Pirellulales bacterium]